MYPLGSEPRDVREQKAENRQKKPSELRLDQKKVEQVAINVEGFHKEIDLANTSEGDVKIRSLYDLEAKVLSAKEFTTTLDLERTNLNTEKEKLEESIKKLQNELVLQQQKFDQITMQINNFDTMKLPNSNMISQALDHVQASLKHLNLPARKEYKLEGTALENMLKSSAVLNQLHKPESKELFLKFDENFTDEDIQAFLQFPQTKMIELTADNVMPLFDLADQYEVKDLLTACCKFVQDNASWSSFPELLQKGLETNRPELIWTALHLATQDPEALSKINNYQDFSEKTKILLKELKALSDQIIFHPDIGHLEVQDNSEQALALLSNLNPLIPISFLKIKNNMSPSDLKPLSKICPSLEHLIVFCPYYNIMKKDLESFEKLKSFGDEGKTFYSIEAIERYKKELAPITMNTLAITINEDYKLWDLAKTLDNLEELIITECDVSSIPKFNFIKSIEIDGCKRLTNIPHDLNTSKLTVRNCNALKYFNPQGKELAELEIDNCDCSDMNRTFYTSAAKVKVKSCRYLQRISESAKEFELYDCDWNFKSHHTKATKVKITRCSSLMDLSVPNATELEINDSTIRGTLEAPKAIDVKINGILSAGLNAPRAIKVEVSNCQFMSEIRASSAIEVEAVNCSKLERLDAPVAKSVHVKNCNPKIRLNVPLDCEKRIT